MNPPDLTNLLAWSGGIMDSVGLEDGLTLGEMQRPAATNVLRCLAAGSAVSR